METPALISRLEAVTVYACGAALTRIADLEPLGDAWPEQVRLVDLPLSLEDGSVKVRVEGDAQGSIPVVVGLRLGLDVTGSGPRPEAGDEEVLREARRELMILEAREEEVGRRADRLGDMEVPARPSGRKGQPPPESPHAARTKLIDFRRERLEELAGERQKLSDDLRAARERVADLTERKRLASSAREARENELRKTAVVSLRAPEGAAAGAARLLLEYHVPGARWAPAYALRFEKDYSRVDLALRAVVAQRTGEDWGDVRLTLSTADMQSWTELPEMNSLRIGRRQPPPRSGWRPPPTGAADLYADYDRYAPPEPVPMVAPRLGAVAGHRADAFDSPEVYTDDDLSDLSKDEPPGEEACGPADAEMIMSKPCVVASTSPPEPDSPVESEPMSDFDLSERSRGGQRRKRSEEGERKIPPAPGRTSGREVISERIADGQPGGAWLDYGLLSMPGPSEPGRGRLTRTEPGNAYLQVFAELQVKVSFNVVDAVRNAREFAGQLEDIPSAHAFPSSVGGFHYAYQSESPAEILSDGQFHSIPLLARRADAELRFVTVPREAQDVFRFAEIANPLAAPLLTGPADVYIGEDFLMTVPLREVAEKGRIRLGLGVEQALKVARNTTFAEESSGLIGGKLTLNHGISIELRSMLSAPVEVEVRERVPVTRRDEDEVKVTIGNVSPPWKPHEPEDTGLKGGYRWVVPVPPGKAVPLSAEYAISLSSKMELVGGNRREC